MATLWMGYIPCRWCNNPAKVGREKNGQGRCYRLICKQCGISSQIGVNLPAGQQITLHLGTGSDPSMHGQ